MTRRLTREAWLCEHSHLFSGGWYVSAKRRRTPIQVEPSGKNGRVRLIKVDPTNIAAGDKPSDGKEK